MSAITQAIEDYRAGNREWPDLRAYLVGYAYGKPARYKTRRRTAAKVEQLASALYSDDGTWDEVRHARNVGLLTRAQYLQVVRAMQRGRPRAAAYEESQHPRGEGGKWVESGDGGSESKGGGSDLERGIARLDDNTAEFEEQEGVVAVVEGTSEAQAYHDEVDQMWEMMRDDIEPESREDLGFQFTNFAIDATSDSNPDVAVFVAGVEGEGISGAASVFIYPERDDPPAEARAYLDYLGTTSISEGAGSALIAAAAEVAADRGVMLVGNPTRDAEPFYEGIGWHDVSGGGAGGATMGWSADEVRQVVSSR